MNPARPTIPPATINHVTMNPARPTITSPLIFPISKIKNYKQKAVVVSERDSEGLGGERKRFWL